MSFYQDVLKEAIVVGHANLLAVAILAGMHIMSQTTHMRRRKSDCFPG
jgi:hypothetical protein